MDQIRTLKIIQCNLDRSKNALLEFVRFFVSEKYSVALVSEPYVGANNFVKNIPGVQIHQFPSSTGRVKACIFVRDGTNWFSALSLSQYSTTNMAVVQLTIGVTKLLLASVYVEPDTDVSGTLDRLDFFLGSVGNSRCVVGGDFNGWHPIWGSGRANARGQVVTDIAHGRDLYFCNTGGLPTFETVSHGRPRASIIDLTLASASAIDLVSDWVVNFEACPTSQHNAITFSIAISNNFSHQQGNKTHSTYRYKSHKANWATFKTELHTLMVGSNLLDTEIMNLDPDSLERYIDRVVNIIHAACKESMPTRGSGGSFKPPWWTDDLEARKREVIGLHRRLHTATRRDSTTDEEVGRLAEDLNAKRTLYAQELREASTADFRDFCNLQTKENVWSLTNRLLKDTAPRRPPTTFKVDDGHTTDAKQTAAALLDNFYPDDTPDRSARHHHLRTHERDKPDTLDEPPFVVEEVLEVLKTMNAKKAPGMDGLTSDICTQFALAYPQLMVDIFNRCLELQHFPRQWKRAFVKIIPKPNKTDYTALTSHRPIGLIPVFGKALEKLFIKRVTFVSARAGKLNSRQFGFKEQTNTTAAISTALEVVRSAKQRKQLVVAVSLDIKAAFDNAWWPALFEGLRRIGCPRNIFGLIESYVEDREAVLDYANERVTKKLSKGCIQGSACGPNLWNIVLDELLEIPLPDGCHLQAFADDVLLIVHHNCADDLQEIANTALQRILEWGECVKLTFSPSKTQLIAFTPKAKEAVVKMGNVQLHFVREIKLLGVIVDEKLLFNSHVQHIINKASRIFNKLCLFSRPTWGAHPENIRTIYLQVIEPIVTYAAGIWGQAALKKGIRRRLLSMQRGFAVRITRAFKTISTTAALALAELTPLDLKVREVHALEQIKLTGVTHLLPHDITLERPTPPHELLHPASRVSLNSSSTINIDDLTPPIQTEKSLNIYTDGSKLEDSSVGAAFVAYLGDRQIATKKFKLHTSCSVFQAELFAIYKACSWANSHHPDLHLTVFSDSQSALAALNNRSNTHPLVSKTHALIYTRAPNSIQITWIKSHVGITGNEAADSAAKHAASLHCSPSYEAFPIGFAKHCLRSEHHRIWQARYESSSQGRHTISLLPKLSDIRKVRKSIKTSFHLTQVLSGHGYCKHYLHRFNITDDHFCPCNGLSVQTFEHLLEHCPRFFMRRMEHVNLCENLRVSPFMLLQVIDKAAAAESLDNFIKNIVYNLKSFNGT